MYTSSLVVGRKTIPFEFVNKTTRHIQDVGGLLRTYEISGVITGPRYAQTRKAFLAAVNKPGIGVFQHPVDGPVKVVCDPVTLTEDDTEFGVCKISIIFRESKDNIYPQEAVDNRSSINKFTANVLAQVEAGVEELYELTAAFRENYQDVKDTLTNIANIADAVTQPFSAVSGFLSDFSSTLKNFKSSIGASIRRPALLAANITQLASALDRLATNPFDRYKLNRSLFKLGASVPLFQPPTATTKSRQRKKNRSLINSQINFAALANAYSAIINVQFQDEAQLLAVAQELEVQYDYTLNMTELDETYLTQIKLLRNQVRIYLENNRINVKKLIPFNADRQSITNVTYAFYSKLDNDQLLININNISTPNNIQGDIYVVTP